MTARQDSRRTPDPYLAGLTMLARRELSAAQVRERLERKGFGRDQVEPALRRLRRAGALDDRRAAHALAHRSAHVRMHGRLRAVREIERRGIDRELAASAVDEAYRGIDEDALIARALARRRRGQVESGAERRRLHRYLVRQGFDGAAAAAALRTRTRAAPPGDGG